MSKRIDAIGNIKDGKLFISFRDRFDRAIEQFTDCRVKIRVEKIYRKRSNPQNAYYHAVIINEFLDGYAEMTGEKITHEEAHEFLKQRFNSKQLINKATGEIADIPQTTTTLTTLQFIEYQEECIRFIAEWFGRVVPGPGEQGEMFNKNQNNND